MIYFDNASTTHTKPSSVISAVHSALTTYSVNAGRGAYKLSVDAGNMVLDTRILIANTFGSPDATNVIFTASCTMAINMAIRGTIKPGGHIVATCFEHNSVLRTLTDIKDKYDIDYTLVSPNKNGTIGVNEIQSAVKPNTYMVITIHSSNVTGITQDIQQIGNFCAKNNLIYMVDGAQSAGHIHINMQDCHINLLTLAGHKGLYGPQGIGVLVLNNISVSPLITGGTGTYSISTTQPKDLPESLESGTLALPNILGLKAGIEYVNSHFDAINKNTSNITKYLLTQLSNIPGVILYSKYNPVGVVSFNIVNTPSTQVAQMLAEYGICVRSGLQCAPLIHKYHGTDKEGMVRISVGAFNTMAQARQLVKAIKIISKKLG